MTEAANRIMSKMAVFIRLKSALGGFARTRVRRVDFFGRARTNGQGTCLFCASNMAGSFEVVFFGELASETLAAEI